ncbi:MAG: T9SS type A sorting domain-containing protein, partial [Bacteroidetes bacterium]|nr:T9SS type A sorting domain-containing protein [Bacteroidota bacterium]
TMYGGATWERQESGTGGIQFLTSIDCINPDIAWIGGDYGKILHTDNGGIVFIQDDKRKIIQEITVNQFPNPFSTSTVLEYTLKQSTNITIHIFNSGGQPVDVILCGQKDKGTHKIQWDAEGFPAGIYFYNLRAGNVNSSGKMVLVR